MDHLGNSKNSGSKTITSGVTDGDKGNRSSGRADAKDGDVGVITSSAQGDKMTDNTPIGRNLKRG